MANVPDPIELLSNLTADQVSERLDKLYAEEAALRVLLRSLRARERTAKGLAEYRAKQQERAKHNHKTS